MKSYLLITGATGGLGAAFVLEAAKRGFDLFLTDLTPEKNGYIEKLSEKFHISVKYNPCDLSNETSRTEFLNEVKQSGLKFWGLINVAGLDHEGVFLERNRSQILKILQVNILGTIDMTHEILPLRDPERPFRLINVCSMAGFYPMPFQAAYAASKRFLLDMSQALREEIKSFGTVTALCPAGMPTTIENMRYMFAQGFWGLATSKLPDEVARMTLKAALKGKRMVIPGVLNQMIHLIGSLCPAQVSVNYVARRWSKAREKLSDPLAVTSKASMLSEG